MLQLVLTVIIFMIIVIPIGNYLYHIASGQRTFADPVFDRWTAGSSSVRHSSRQGHELEAVCAGSSADQRRDGVCRLSGPENSVSSHLQPQRPSARWRRPCPSTRSSPS